MVAATSAACLLCGDARAQVLPPLDDPLNRTLEERLPPLDERVGSRLEDRLEDARETAESADEAGGEAVDDTLDTAGETAATVVEEAGSTVAGATQAVGAAAGAVLRPFAIDSDPFGRTIERNVLVVLVDEAALAEVLGFGLEVVAERDMPGLGMTLVTLEGRGAGTLGEVANELRRAVPAATVDYNHVYEPAAETFPLADGAEGFEDAAGDAPAGDPLYIGMIDSAVDPSHVALAGNRIVAEDFVANAGDRPLGHGTAVASLLADATSGNAEIYAASVFFRLPNRNAGATTESLVAALDWLAGERVDAINMSLSGPPNALLERALRNMAGDGPTVVAAVGNNGPTGAPMFPAAYAQVIGVTAVDRDNRIFREANRGSHVAFAARGVNVKVADAEGGGWRIESGTSMASPFVAAVVAAEYRLGHRQQTALMRSLTAQAEDLGREGFDEVFGHGLLARRPAIASNVRTPPRD